MPLFYILWLDFAHRASVCIFREAYFSYIDNIYSNIAVLFIMHIQHV